MNYGTLPSRFLNAVDNLPNPRAQMVRRDGKWEAIPSQEFLRRVAGLSTAFVELGVKPGDRVGLFSANCPEWHTADFAINGASAIDSEIGGMPLRAIASVFFPPIARSGIPPISLSMALAPSPFPSISTNRPTA